MGNANYQNKKPELTEALKTWQTPDVTPEFDRRVMEAYRQQVNRAPFWKRFFTSSIRVPMPIIAAQALLFLIAGGAVIASLGNIGNAPLPVAQSSNKAEVSEAPAQSAEIATHPVYAGRKLPAIKKILTRRQTANAVEVSEAASPALTTLPFTEPIATPQTGHSIAPNLAALSWEHRPELSPASLNLPETAFNPESSFAPPKINNIESPFTYYVKPSESSPMRLTKFATLTTGFMVRMIDGKPTRFFARFVPWKTRSFDEENNGNQALLYRKLNAKFMLTSFGDTCGAQFSR